MPSISLWERKNNAESFAFYDPVLPIRLCRPVYDPQGWIQISAEIRDHTFSYHGMRIAVIWMADVSFPLKALSPYGLPSALSFLLSKR